jgi:hypothetical protein
MHDANDPPIREFADRGTLWLLESTSNLRDLVADALDFGSAERVNRSFVPADLHKQEADLLYRVPFRTGKSEVWIHLLVEHPSKPDLWMNLRVLSYMVQVWDMQRHRWEQERPRSGRRRLAPIVPLVFYTGKRRWARVPGLEAVMQASAALQRFVPRHETLFVGLDGLPEASDGLSPLATVLRVLLAADGDTEAMKAALATAMRELEALPPEAQGERHEEVNEMTMTGAEALMREGHRLGVDEGRRIGVDEGRRLGVDEGRMEAAHAMLIRPFGASVRSAKRRTPRQDRHAHRRRGEPAGRADARRPLAGGAWAVGEVPRL